MYSIYMYQTEFIIEATLVNSHVPPAALPGWVGGCRNIRAPCPCFFRPFVASICMTCTHATGYPQESIQVQLLRYRCATAAA